MEIILDTYIKTSQRAIYKSLVNYSFHVMSKNTRVLNLINTLGLRIPVFVNVVQLLVIEGVLQGRKDISKEINRPKPREEKFAQLNGKN